MVDSLKLRLFYSILAMVAVLSSINIAGNIAGSFPATVNGKWLLLILISAIAFFAAKKRRYTERVMFAFFLFLIIAFFPYAYIESGGSANNGLGYVYLTLICITYLFRSWRRWFFVLLLIAVFLSLHTLEYTSPELFPVYPADTQFIDRIIQVPLILLVSAAIIWRFAKDYEQATSKLAYYAHRDDLTGLFNRRLFNQYIDDIMHSPGRDGYLALIDLDNFKLINDFYGHASGDRVLKSFANLLQQQFPEAEHMLSRWGGDEFAIVFCGEKDELLHRLKNVRTAFEKNTEVFEKRVGISFGFTRIASAESVSELLHSADQNQYSMKSERKKPASTHVYNGYMASQTE
ncbi:sensor domain-containing diguanylate cyclase [Salisediminibacterium halotolerans]|uniref:Diguanylate cyclase (GGDEF) domain-containing protein n=1 Tax=Salisediminibacterium halotolerans TaxID=517425 RepID=A0A1H9QV31_9BACI|nr:GGDEF domain-containing protein [Salisediminibacterium haloalkalitolerans]SER64481.1 diguanylate cyclase (GGDEF) domain-containing protein [Salisediminibacterium haloalkalitolerans]